MSEYATGGIIPGSHDRGDDAIPALLTVGCTYYWPADYRSPGYIPPKPLADWMINGRRYRQVACTHSGINADGIECHDMVLARVTEVQPPTAISEPSGNYGPLPH
ncbi:hypothetical protein [Nocardia sp. NBC_01388]|uniref:hypothetical protein n=1 Tax=Nocardia sp. NBC_01388 TaxID=2903596 RepID=UPI00324DD21B